MRLLTVTLPILLLAPILRADDFDLNYDPGSKDECGRIMKKMLNTGEGIEYRKDHKNQKLWIFRPADLKKDELRPCIFFIHGGGWGGDPETLVVSGENDHVITPDQNRAFVERMKVHGNKCSLVIYPDGKHGWFNYGRGGNSAFHATMGGVDKFLTRLGYIASN